MRARIAFSALLLFLSTVASVGEVSLDCRAADPAKAISGCTIFLQATGTSKSDQAYAYALRAEAFMTQRQLDAAAKDLEKAFRLAPNHVVVLTARGRLRFFRADYKGALADLDAALRQMPSYAVARRLRGMTHMDLTNYKEAKQDLDLVIANNPTDATALANRGKLHRLQNNIDLSLADLDRAVAIAPKWTWALLQRADTYQLKGDYQRAIADYDQALALNPNDAEAQRRRAAAMALLRPGGGAPLPQPKPPPAPVPGKVEGPSGPAGGPVGPPPPTANVQQALQQARSMLDRRDAKGAHKIATDVLRFNPALAEAYLLRGRAFYLESMFPEAIDDLSRYVGFKPSDATGYYYRGLARAQLGRSDEVRADADQFRRLAPTNSSGHFLLGFNHHLAGRYEQADEEYTAGIKMKATDPLHINRALVRMELGRYGDAEADLQQAFALNARNPAIPASKGQLQARTGKIEQAEASFRDALAIDPSNVAARIGQQALFAARALKQLPSSPAQSK